MTDQPMTPAPPTLSQLVDKFRRFAGICNDNVAKDELRRDYEDLAEDKAKAETYTYCADELAAALPDCRTCEHDDLSGGCHYCSLLDTYQPPMPFGCLAWQPQAHAPRTEE